MSDLYLVDSIPSVSAFDSFSSTSSLTEVTDNLPEFDRSPGQCQEKEGDAGAQPLHRAQGSQVISHTKLDKLRLYMLVPYHYATSRNGRQVDARKLTLGKLRTRINMLSDVDRVSTSALVSRCPVTHEKAFALVDTSLAFFGSMLRDHTGWRASLLSQVSVGLVDVQLEHTAEIVNLTDPSSHLRPAATCVLKAEQMALTALRWSRRSLPFAKKCGPAAYQLDLSIGWLHRIVGFIERRHAELLVLTNAAQPIARLVPDVFHLVLEYVADAEPPSGKKFGWMRLAHVSHQFRCAVMDASSLWARDMFKLRDKAMRLGPRRQQRQFNPDLLSRARGSPLNVSSVYGCTWAESWEQTEAFAQLLATERVETLRLSLPYSHWMRLDMHDPEAQKREDEEYEQKRVVAARALRLLLEHISGECGRGHPALERLELKFRGKDDGALPTLSGLPLLRELQIIGFYAPIAVTNLETLAIVFDPERSDHPSLDTLLDVLERSSRLSTLNLSRYRYEGPDSSSTAQTHRTVTLPNLTSLLLGRCGSLLAHLCAPSARLTKIHCAYDGRIPPDEAVAVLRMTLDVIPSLFPLPTHKTLYMAYHRSWEIMADALEIGFSQVCPSEQGSSPKRFDVLFQFEGNDVVDQSSALPAIAEALGALGIASTIDVVGLNHYWHHASDGWCRQAVAPFRSASQLHIFDRDKRNAFSRLKDCDTLPALTTVLFANPGVLWHSIDNQEWTEVFDARLQKGNPIRTIRVDVEEDELYSLEDVVPTMETALRGIARVARVRDEESPEPDEKGHIRAFRVFELAYDIDI